MASAAAALEVSIAARLSGPEPGDEILGDGPPASPGAPSPQVVRSQMMYSPKVAAGRKCD